LSANLGERQVEEVLSETLNRPAPRPQNSRLRCLYSEKLGLSPLPDWRDALRKFAAET
jgi:dTDP-4-dehydrorhamnose reductase